LTPTNIRPSSADKKDTLNYKRTVNMSEWSDLDMKIKEIFDATLEPYDIFDR